MLILIVDLTLNSLKMILFRKVEAKIKDLYLKN
jgi:hypothetical protein